MKGRVHITDSNSGISIRSTIYSALLSRPALLCSCQWQTHCVPALECVSTRDRRVRVLECSQVNHQPFAPRLASTSTCTWRLHLSSMWAGLYMYSTFQKNVNKCYTTTLLPYPSLLLYYRTLLAFPTTPLPYPATLLLYPATLLAYPVTLLPYPATLLPIIH